MHAIPQTPIVLLLMLGKSGLHTPGSKFQQPALHNDRIFMQASNNRSVLVTQVALLDKVASEASGWCQLVLLLN